MLDLIQELEVRIRLPPADSPSPSGFSPRPGKNVGFPPFLAAVRGGSVGRDAHSPATSRRGGVVSLSVDIPVPHCCRRRFAELAVPAANEIGFAISVGLGVSDRLKQSRAGPVDLARPMADVSAPAACRRSGGMAGARREWLA